MDAEAPAASATLERRYPSRTSNSRQVAEGLLAIDADRMRGRGWEVASATWIENRWVRRIDFVFSVIDPHRLLPHGGSWGHLEVAYRRATSPTQAGDREAGHPEP